MSRSARAISALEAAAFCALIVGAGAFVAAVRTRANWDQDIWWHLATGRWMAQHGWVPTTDPFSQYGHDKPWVSYSWLFERVVYGAYTLAGLRGIVLFAAAVTSLNAAALYALIRRCGATPFVAIPLTAVCVYALMPLTTPRPWLFSMLFFLTELHVIVAAQTGRIRWLWLLPPVFLLWANMHIQFVLGFVVLLFDAADAYWNGERGELARWLGIGVACVLATLVNPYHVNLYRVALEYVGATALWTRIGEFAAPTFRTTPDWVILAVVLSAAVCIGWQLRDGTLRLFWPLLFIVGTWLGFRTQRDMWFVVMTSACIIGRTASRVGGLNQDGTNVSTWIGMITATTTAAALLLFAAWPLNEQRLEANVARSYPVAAAAFLNQRGAVGPLYNHFDWGGYLIWRLPELPVSMDGRTPVHGEPRIVQHVDTWQGTPAWSNDPDLQRASIVVGPRDAPLASLLRADDRFTAIYEDPDGPAVVFERKR